MEKRLIKQILLEQRRELSEIYKQKIIVREIEQKNKKILDSALIKVIMGVRRCGKSVLSHQLLKNKKYAYVNFDDERLIGIKAENLNDFLEVLKEIDPDFEYLLLDEVQNVKGWELFVNRLKRSGYNIIVTGSNSELLSKELASHLTGRHFSLELYPFSFWEFLVYKDLLITEEDFYITEQIAKIKGYLGEYIEKGGFPEIFNTELKRHYLRELYDKIITRDILLRYNIKYAKTLKEIALLALSQFSMRMSFHKIKNIAEMKSIHTVKNYLHYLEDAYILFQVNSFTFKFKEQIKQPRKIYGIDSGLINAVVPKVTSDYGKLMENVVFLELKRRNKEIYYYHQQNYEIDFLIKEKLKIGQLIQVSYSLEHDDTRKREIRALIKASRELRCENLLIITWDVDGKETIKDKTIQFIPLWKWLLS